MRPLVKSILPTLFKLVGDEDEVRNEAMEALRQFGPDARGAVPALTALLQAKENNAGGWRRNPQSDRAGCLGGGPALAKLLSDEHLMIRFEASRALIKIGPPAVPFLITALQESPTACVHAAFALGSIGPSAKAAVRP